MPVLHPFDLSDRRALVTGAGGGLGFAIATGLACAGAHVVLNGRNRAKLDAAKASLESDGMTAHVAAFDVTDAPAVNDAIEDIERRIGPLPLLHHHAPRQR